MSHRVIDVLHMMNCIISARFLDMYRIYFYYLFHVSDGDAHSTTQGDYSDDSIDSLEPVHSSGRMAV